MRDSILLHWSAAGACMLPLRRGPCPCALPVHMTTRVPAPPRLMRNLPRDVRAPQGPLQPQPLPPLWAAGAAAGGAGGGQAPLQVRVPVGRLCAGPAEDHVRCLMPPNDGAAAWAVPMRRSGLVMAGHARREDCSARPQPPPWPGLAWPSRRPLPHWPSLLPCTALCCCRHKAAVESFLEELVVSRCRLPAVAAGGGGRRRWRRRRGRGGGERGGSCCPM